MLDSLQKYLYTCLLQKYWQMLDKHLLMDK